MDAAENAAECQERKEKMSMTGISPASSGASGVSMGAMSGENSRLKALEQKLGKLEK